MYTKQADRDGPDLVYILGLAVQGNPFFWAAFTHGVISGPTLVDQLQQNRQIF